ncbi:class I SAM-dependent methyltransferase [bacterium]|nr:class I SAM-dependent methyltransferase [bacterium]
MEWIADQYDQFQKRYQLKNGLDLISKLEAITNLKDRDILDLGCGNGELSLVLADKIGLNGSITAVDRDEGMLEVFKEKAGSNRVKICREDLLPWLDSDRNRYDIVFSNAVFHWLSTAANLLGTFAGIYKVLKYKGCLAVRFSLEGNAEETKGFLEKQLRYFLNDNSITLSRSRFNYKQCATMIEQCGFELLESIEKVFVPFSEPESHFQWMIKSQPLLNYLNANQLELFKSYLYQQWKEKPVQVKSHHGVFLAQKPASSPFDNANRS